MKVSEIISHVEYLKPTTTKNCRDGWSMDEIGERLGSNPDPKQRIVSPGWVGPGKPLERDELSSSPEVSNSNWTDLKEELSKGISHEPLKGKVQLVG